MFRNVSPTVTTKHNRSRAQEADYDILGGVSKKDVRVRKAARVIARELQHL